MSTVSIVAASEVPWADVEQALTGGGDGGSCWCQWFLLKRAEFAGMSREDKREQLRRELSTADPPPALLARVEGAAAGWVRVGPRPSQGRLSATRVVASGSPEPADDPAVWAITCLVVRREHRRQGVAKALVEAAVRHAARNGARLIEAYPIDTDRRAGGHDQDRDPAPLLAANLSRSEIGNHPRLSGPEAFRHMALAVNSRIAGRWGSWS